MPRNVSDSVVVITGASSGIGRAAALAFARRGAAVVVSARREEPLRDLAAECERAGGRAIAVPADVTEEEAVANLARRAAEQFGRIDTWLNNAGVTLFGRFEEVPPDAFRRVIETNLFGYTYGARAALRYFREQGSGVLINNASIVAVTGQPFTTPYAVSKWAVRGLADSLRMELSVDGRHDIHVCTLLPASIDTPLFQHAANYSGRAVRPIPPVYPAEEVAEAMVDLAEHPRREALVGGSGRLLTAQYTVAPGLTERLFARTVNRGHFQEAQAEPTSGNLFEPVPEGTGVIGGWQGARRTGMRRLAFAGAAAAIPALAAWIWLRPKVASSR